MIRKSDLIDIPERRSVPITEFEVRSQGSTAHVQGYASIFDKGYDIMGGPEAGGWTEHVNQGAFKRTLADSPDVVLLENHTGGPLARTKSGTLDLATDKTGLLSKFSLDLRDPQAQSVFVKLDRGDYDEMSFAFRVKANTWTENDTVRSLDEVSLHKGDVSIVNFGANPFTSVGLRSAVKMLAREEFSDDEMAELRAMSAQVDRAMAALSSARADDKPYGDVPYADPKNGKYPINTKEHVKAAWSYINMPKNQKDYTSAELIEIKSRIREAAKKFGIEIADDEHNSLRGRIPNIIVGDQSEFARKVHGIALRAGANCDPAGDASADGELLPLRADSGAGLEDGDVFDDDSERNGLAQAVHDLVADAAGACDVASESDPEGGDDDMTPYDSLRKMTVAEATRAATSPGNLTAAEAMRMCRPEDSPEPLTVAEALKLAS